MTKTTGKFIIINGGTIGYINKEDGKWVGREYLKAHGRTDGIIVTGYKTKKETAEAYGKLFLAK